MLKGILYFLLILVVPAILYILSLETVVPMPSDDSHRGVQEIARCFECHGDGMEFARTEEHPPKDQCFSCHEIIQRPRTQE